MTKRNKVISGLVLGAVLSTGLFANNFKDEHHNKHKMMKMHKNKHMKRGHFAVLPLIKKLNLTDEQKTNIKKIMIESKKNQESVNDAFSKTSFDKEKFIKIIKDKKENMIQSKANLIEKVYNLLDSKQKEQLKVLLDEKKEKREKRFSKRMEKLEQK